MKIIMLLLSLIVPFTSFSQKQVKEKETVYLLFDKLNKEKCKCLIEDGSGNSNYLNKYRKENREDFIYFRICDELFTFHKTKSFKDTCLIKTLENIKLVDLNYVNDKKSKNILRYNPFEQIFIIEKISKDKIVKYEVTWIDDWTMIED